jgi:hypothetical protein
MHRTGFEKLANLLASQAGFHKSESSVKAWKIRVEFLEEVFR